MERAYVGNVGVWVWVIGAVQDDQIYFAWHLGSITGGANLGKGSAGLTSTNVRVYRRKLLFFNTVMAFLNLRSAHICLYR